ncbi:MAG: DUF5665 domain-containing protein [Andreesenia angusta]|nr:DUF5665 domain-containing protein [Andreesenia angusta]
MKISKVKDRLKDRHEYYRSEEENIKISIEENQMERERLKEKVLEVEDIIESMKNEKREMYVLASKLDMIADKLERNQLQEYLHLINNRKKLLLVNFLSGLAKGFGTVIGFTILAGVVLYILKSMISLPIIGDFIANIIEIVQSNLANR